MYYMYVSCYTVQAFTQDLLQFTATRTCQDQHGVAAARDNYVVVRVDDATSVDGDVSDRVVLDEAVHAKVSSTDDYKCLNVY